MIRRKRLPTICASMMKLSMTAGRWRFLIRKQPGKQKRYSISLQRNFRCLFLSVVNWYISAPLKEIRKYCAEQIDTLWDEIKRFDNPQNYYVDLSRKLWDIKYSLLKKNKSGN